MLARLSAAARRYAAVSLLGDRMAAAPDPETLYTLARAWLATHYYHVRRTGVPADPGLRRAHDPTLPTAPHGPRPTGASTHRSKHASGLRDAPSVLKQSDRRPACPR